MFEPVLPANGHLYTCYARVVFGDWWSCTTPIAPRLLHFRVVVSRIFFTQATFRFDAYDPVWRCGNTPSFYRRIECYYV